MVKNLLIGILMPTLVFSILSYTCYQYTWNVHEFSLASCKNKEPIIALILCTASLVSYSVIMLTASNPLPINSAKVPEKFIIPAGSPVVNLSLSTEKGDPLYCQTCNTIKPERAHHCKECNRCALKMDHHCLWINGCVDQNNYKLFFLFVFYVALYSLFVVSTLAPKLLKAIKSEIGNITLGFYWKLYKVYISSIYYLWKNVSLVIWHRKWISLFTGVQGLGLESISLHWYAVTALGFLFGLTLTGFTAVHFWYIIKNQTSIEHVANRPLYVRADFDTTGNNYEVIVINNAKTMYNIGLYRNWCSVMGSNPIKWLVPVKVETVVSHPYNLKFCMDIIESAKIQRQQRLKGA